MPKPIMFSPDLVQAILENRKTQTRRVLKMPIPPNCDQPVFGATGRGWFFDTLDNDGNCLDMFPGNDEGILCPYGQPGDLLYVRETWWGFGHFENTGNLTKSGRPERKFVWNENEDSLRYYLDSPDKPDHEPAWTNPVDPRDDWHKRPSIFMPHWASRLTLKVTDIRVERVQAISETDAIAEGVAHNWLGDIDTCPIEYQNEWMNYLGGNEDPPCCSARESFRTLWDKINAKRGYSWDSNPWVWTVSFEVAGVNRFAVGDQVTWSKISRRGGTTSIDAREGVIISLKGNVAKVRPNGKAKSTEVQLARLRPKGEKTELSEFVDAMFEAHREKVR